MNNKLLANITPGEILAKDYLKAQRGEVERKRTKNEPNYGVTPLTFKAVPA